MMHGEVTMRNGESEYIKMISPLKDYIGYLNKRINTGTLVHGFKHHGGNVEH